MTPVGGPLRRISDCIPSFANITSFHCCVHFSHERGGVMVAFSLKASICRGIFLESVADCALLYC